MTAHNKGHRGKTPRRESQWMGPTIPASTEPRERWLDQMGHARRKQHGDVLPIGELNLAETKLVPQRCKCGGFPYTDEDGERRCLACSKGIGKAG